MLVYETIDGFILYVSAIPTAARAADRPTSLSSRFVRPSLVSQALHPEVHTSCTTNTSRP